MAPNPLCRMGFASRRVPYLRGSMNQRYPAGSVGVRGSSPLSSTRKPCVYRGFRMSRGRVAVRHVTHLSVGTEAGERPAGARRSRAVGGDTTRHGPTATLWCERFNCVGWVCCTGRCHPDHSSRCSVHSGPFVRRARLASGAYGRCDGPRRGVIRIDTPVAVIQSSVEHASATPANTSGRRTESSRVLASSAPAAARASGGSARHCRVPTRATGASRPVAVA